MKIKKEIKFAFDVGDDITFTVNGETLMYRILSNYLSCYHDNNNVLFQRLGVNKKAEMSEVYGYEAGSGYWPTCKDNDMLNHIAKIIKWAESKGVTVT